MSDASDPVEIARAAVRAWNMKVTPYRVGIAMGQAFATTFRAYTAAATVSRDYSGRPEAPACPYAHRLSARNWREGFERELRKTS